MNKFLQAQELQGEVGHFKTDLSEARAQYKDCAQEVSFLPIDLFRLTQNNV